MNAEELALYTTQIIKKLVVYGRNVKIDKRSFESIIQLHESTPPDSNNITRKKQYTVKGDGDFKIPDKLSSYPYIHSINDDGTLGLTTLEPNTSSLSNKNSLLPELRPTRS
jgi:hypothetical protein